MPPLLFAQENRGWASALMLLSPPGSIRIGVKCGVRLVTLKAE